MLMQVEERLRSVNGKVQCHGQCHTWKVHGAPGEHRGGGTHPRLWVGMGQSAKTDRLGLETCAEVRGRRKRRSRLCAVGSVGRVELKGVWACSAGLWYGSEGGIEGCWRVLQEPLNSEHQRNHWIQSTKETAIENWLQIHFSEPLCKWGPVFWPKDCIIYSSSVLLCRSGRSVGMWGRRREGGKDNEEERKNKERKRDFWLQSMKIQNCEGSTSGKRECTLNAKNERITWKDAKLSVLKQQVNSASEKPHMLCMFI